MPREKWVGENTWDCMLINASCRRATSLVVTRLAGPQAYEIINEGVTRAGVESAEILSLDIGNVRDASDIEHGDRMRSLERAHHCAMEDRDHRRALASGRKVGGAKVINDGYAESISERGTVAELDAEPMHRPVHHRLAMKSDKCDRAGVHAIGSQEGFHCLRVHVGQRVFRLNQKRGP